MNRPIAVAALVALGVAGAAEAQTWTEPKSGIAFPVKRDDLTLLGGGLRVRKILVTFKVYAVMRDLSQSRIQEAMRESLAAAEPKVLDQFVSYFPEVKAGGRRR